MKKTIILLILAAAMILPVYAGGSKEGAAYPSEPINIVVPSNAGGSTDATARQFGQIAKKYWPEANFVVVNIGGSGGLKGFDEIADAKPNGYNLGMLFTPQIVSHICSGLAHYSLDSFHYIGNIVEDPGIVVVPEKSTINTLDELKAAAKASKLVATVNGIGSDDYIAAKNFEKIAGVEFNIMPTNGSTEQKAAILGGHVDVAFMNLSQMLANYRSGKVKIIAITTRKRSEMEKSIPTTKEQGYEFYMTATRGLVCQASVDSKITKALDDLLVKVLADPEFKDLMEKQLISLAPMNSKEYREHLEELKAQTQVVYDAAPWGN